MMARAIEARGARVTMLTCGGGLEICDRTNVTEGPPMPCRTCTAYVDRTLHAHGLSRAQLMSRGTDAAWPELDATGVAELMQVGTEGLALGELVDIPVKWFLLTGDLTRDPLGGVTKRRFLRAGRAVARAIDDWFDELRPDVIVLLNGLFFFESIAWEIARRRGIDVVTYERGFIKETIVVARDTPAAHYEIDEAWNRWKDVPLTPVESEELDAYLADREHGRRSVVHYQFDHTTPAPTAAPGRTAVLFTNITWDSAVLGREDAFASIHAWLDAAVDVFAARPDDRLIIRVHPAEVRLPGKPAREPLGDYIRGQPPLPPNVSVVDAADPQSSYPLMEMCDVGLVYTSTVGLELALRGKPVVVAGRTHYSDKGFTIPAVSPAQFCSTLTAVLDDPADTSVDVEQARRYAYMFFFRNAIASPGVEEHVSGLARLTVTDPASLAPGGDPEIDRLCRIILEGESPIADPPAPRAQASP
jgi:hypothetical protein